jgi:hypothetical protein
MGMLELERMRWHHAQSECDGKGSLLNYTILEETTLGDAEYVLHSTIGTVQLTPLWPCQLHRRMRRLEPKRSELSQSKFLFCKRCKFVA